MAIYKALVLVAYFYLLAESLPTMGAYSLAMPIAHLLVCRGHSRVALAIRRNALHVGIWAYAVSVGLRISEEAGWAMAALPLVSLALATLFFRHVDQGSWPASARAGLHWMFLLATGIALLVWYALLAIEYAHPGSTGSFLFTPPFRLC